MSIAASELLQSAAKASTNPTPDAFRWRPPKDFSTRGFRPHTQRKPRHEPPAPPIPPPCRPEKSVRDRCKSYSWRLPRLRGAAARSFQHHPQISLGLEKSVLRSGLADLQNRRDFRVPKAFHFIQQKNVPLVPRQLR